MESYYFDKTKTKKNEFENLTKAAQKISSFLTTFSLTSSKSSMSSALSSKSVVSQSSSSSSSSSSFYSSTFSTTTTTSLQLTTTTTTTTTKVTESKWKYKCNIKIEYGNSEISKMIMKTMKVDRELNPEKCYFCISVIENSILYVKFVSTELRLLRTCLSSFFDTLLLSSRTICTFPALSSTSTSFS